MIKTKLRLTGRQMLALLPHLFPGDGKEAVAVALCGTGDWEEEGVVKRVVCVNEIIPIPYDHCSTRTDKRVIWSTDLLPDILRKAIRRNQIILKIHSHPKGLVGFSDFDNKSDRELFSGIAGWLDTDFPGLSAIVLPDGRMVARAVRGNGAFEDVVSLGITGSEIKLWYPEQDITEEAPDFMVRTVQTFGQGTTQIMSRLSVGVVGVSGTGSPVAEMLYRLGVGELVLVDGDVMKKENIGRIYNSSFAHVLGGDLKVHIMADAVKRSGLPTKVVPIPEYLFKPDVVRMLSQCDVIFGCMDSYDGRELLNRLCSAYCLPYFDVGVKLEADGIGGVDQVCGTVHYLQPDGSSLLSRGVINLEDIQADALRRTNPEEYKDMVRSKYIKGVQEDRPAVVSVNTLVASLAVNDLLARLHPFRDDPNTEFESIGISLTQTRLVVDPESKPCPVMAKYTGRGDMKPLLNMPCLSERREAHA